MPLALGLLLCMSCFVSTRPVIAMLTSIYDAMSLISTEHAIYERGPRAAHLERAFTCSCGRQAPGSRRASCLHPGLYCRERAHADSTLVKQIGQHFHAVFTDEFQRLGILDWNILRAFHLQGLGADDGVYCRSPARRLGHLMCPQRSLRRSLLGGWVYGLSRERLG